MRKYPTKRFIQETKAIMRLSQFLRAEIDLKCELSAKELKQLLYILKTKKKA